jgi:Ca-activated chloride channel family protein
MLKGLDAISEANPEVPPVGDAPETGPAPAEAEPGANGYVPDIVVLLTDGASNRGIEPLDAVPYAVERRVRVFTIGFGTENPASRSCTRDQLGGDAFGYSGFRRGGGFGGGFGGGGFRGGGRFGADIPTLQAVAKQTGGTYHGAEDAEQLRGVFADLPKDVATQKQPTEITWILAAFAALLAAAAIAASMRWSPYP